MRHILMAALVIAMAMALASCIAVPPVDNGTGKKDEGMDMEQHQDQAPPEEESNVDPMVGTWIGQDITFSLKNDGTATVMIYGSTYPGVWTRTGDKFDLRYERYKGIRTILFSDPYTLDGDSFRCYDYETGYAKDFIKA